MSDTFPLSLSYCIYQSSFVSNHCQYFLICELFSPTEFFHSSRDRPKLYFSFSAETKLLLKLTFWFLPKTKTKRYLHRQFPPKTKTKLNALFKILRSKQ